MTAKTSMTSLVPAPLLVLGSVVSIQIGQTFGKVLFGETGPLGVAAMRLGFAALILVLWWRPKLPTDWRTAGWVVALGTAIAAMNVIYPALAYLPVGIAVTFQLFGPFVLAFAGSRRPRDVIWALLAFGGVMLLALPGGGLRFSALGVGLALLSGGAIAAYLVLNRVIGARTADGSLLAWSVAWAAVLMVPAGIAESGPDLIWPQVLALGLVMAIVSAVIPYSLDLMSLRRMRPGVVAVMVSLEPVVAALAGMVMLGEMLALTQWLAVVSISVASMGAVHSHLGGRETPRESRLIGFGGSVRLLVTQRRWYGWTPGHHGPPSRGAKGRSR